jgi:hypothetical protein
MSDCRPEAGRRLSRPSSLPNYAEACGAWLHHPVFFGNPWRGGSDHARSRPARGEACDPSFLGIGACRAKSESSPIPIGRFQQQTYCLSLIHWAQRCGSIGTVHSRLCLPDKVNGFVCCQTRGSLTRCSTNAEPTRPERADPSLSESPSLTDGPRASRSLCVLGVSALCRPRQRR